MPEDRRPDDATTNDAQARRLRDMADALRTIIAEAEAARSALCENELVIRLDTITATARKAIGDGGPR
ncbi:hypothetical protein [Azospirillum sp. TSO35-2]|uniref:hypothetical protein n=1 Tax=Azospirillum sp. TSO35-2 TaxID=716796 RepID=UPI000D605FDC|nr:hypothetical protein [Azospirillum sp. TSO35-2]PWC33169.1 hypothetical protein TSO352_21815 [Azospirillum sp. TSO35-2]